MRTSGCLNRDWPSTRNWWTAILKSKAKPRTLPARKAFWKTTPRCGGGGAGRGGRRLRPPCPAQHCRNFSGRQHTNLGGSGDSSLHLHSNSALARSESAGGECDIVIKIRILCFPGESCFSGQPSPCRLCRLPGFKRSPLSLLLSTRSEEHTS